MSKIEKIKRSLAETRLKRMGQSCKVFELKIDESKLSVGRLKKINDCFIQSKWIYNNLIAQGGEIKFNPSQKSLEVNVFNPETQKCDKIETRSLTIGSQIKQSICDRFVKNIVGLSRSKSKGCKIGKLKFKKDVSSVPLKQFGTTYRIIDDKTISIQAVGKLKVRGLHQVKNKDIANAHLIKTASGFFVKVTCYEKKESRTLDGEVGIDFGIKDNIILSDGRKFSWNFEIPEKLKRKHKRLSKKQKGSNNYNKLCRKIKRNYESYSNKKDDASNKFVSSLKNYKKVVIQNENIKGWYSGLFGKQVQQSILGRIKTGITQLETSIVIDRWPPTTKISPITGKNISINLNNRRFIDGEFSEDRDVKSAKTILCFGLYNPNLTFKELKSLPLEEIASIFERFYPFESKPCPLNEEALTQASG